MPQSSRESFRIQHAMLGIAATALGLAWVQAEWEPIRLFAGQFAEKPSLSAWYLGDRPLYQMTRVAIRTGLYGGTAIACPVMVLLLLLERRGGRRRPIWRARRPGAVGCLAGTIVLVFELVHQAIRSTAAVHVVHFVTKAPEHARYLGWDFDTFTELRKWDPLQTTLIGMPRQAGLVVGGAWLALILAGAWRPQPTWIDRAGRIVGVFWIVAACHFFLLPL
jgi:hypothetical protein